MSVKRCIDVKKMCIYNTALKLARFIHIIIRKKAVNSQQKGNILEFWEAALSYRALQQKSTSISQEKITDYCREFKGKRTI